MSPIFANYPAFIVLNVTLPPRRIFFRSKPCVFDLLQSSISGRSKYLSLNRLFRVELTPYIQKNHKCCAMDAMNLVDSREPERIISAGRAYGRSDIISTNGGEEEPMPTDPLSPAQFPFAYRHNILRACFADLIGTGTLDTHDKQVATIARDFSRSIESHVNALLSAYGVQLLFDDRLRRLALLRPADTHQHIFGGQRVAWPVSEDEWGNVEVLQEYHPDFLRGHDYWRSG